MAPHSAQSYHSISTSSSTTNYNSPSTIIPITSTTPHHVDSLSPSFTDFPNSFVTLSLHAPSQTTTSVTTNNQNYPITTTQPPELKRRQGIWREPFTTSHNVAACSPITLQPGTFIIGTTTIIVPPGATNLPVFQLQCLYGRPVAGLVPIQDGIVDNQLDAWQAWLTDDSGRFASSVVPLMYSIAASSATCWLFTLIVLGFQHKRPLLYKVSLIGASVYLLVVLIYFTNILNDQFAQGYLDSTELRQELRVNIKISALNLAFNTLLFLAQVQTAISLFNRQKEKRLVFWLGGSLTVISQTIWGISVFHPASVLNSLPAFAYLFQTAMGVLYTGCVLYYAITNRQSTLNPAMLLLTFLAIVAAASPIILFIVDLANVWVIEWSDAISWVTAMASIVTVREWADRVYRLERNREKNGTLGRQIFDEEIQIPIHRMPPKDPPAPKTLRRPIVSDSQSSISSGNTPTPIQVSPKSDVFRSEVSGSTCRNSRLHERTARSSHSDSDQDNANAELYYRANIIHAVIDSPFDPYEDRNVFIRYFHKAVRPILVVSDVVINLGLSVSRPLTSVSTSPPPEITDSRSISHAAYHPESHHLPTLPEINYSGTNHTRTYSNSSQLSHHSPLPQFFYPPRKKDLKPTGPANE